MHSSAAIRSVEKLRHTAAKVTAALANLRAVPGDEFRTIEKHRADEVVLVVIAEDWFTLEAPGEKARIRGAQHREPESLEPDAELVAPESR